MTAGVSLPAVVDALDVTADDDDDVTLPVATASTVVPVLSVSVFGSSETLTSVLSRDVTADADDDFVSGSKDIIGSSSFTAVFIIISSLSQFQSTFFDIQSSVPILSARKGLTSVDPPAELSLVMKSMLWCPVVNFTTSEEDWDASDIARPGTRLFRTPADWLGSSFTDEKSYLPASVISALPVSDIMESVPPRFNPDIEMSELALAVAVSRDDDGINASVLGAAERLNVEAKDSLLAATDSVECEADDDITPAEEVAADVMQLVLARLRRADATELLPATSVALASSMSRSLSSLR